MHVLSDKGGQGRKRVRQHGKVADTTEVGEYLYKGECGSHTLDDVDRLITLTNTGYLLRKRKTLIKGRENIAENCWGCGETL